MSAPYTIATVGSHSALQTLKRAKNEDFKALAICLKRREKPYQRLDKQLASQNVILSPHASLITYLGHKKVEKLKVTLLPQPRLPLKLPTFVRENQSEPWRINM